MFEHDQVISVAAALYNGECRVDEQASTVSHLPDLQAGSDFEILGSRFFDSLKAARQLTLPAEDWLKALGLNSSLRKNNRL